MFPTHLPFGRAEPYETVNNEYGIQNNGCRSHVISRPDGNSFRLRLPYWLLAFVRASIAPCPNPAPHSVLSTQYLVPGMPSPDPRPLNPEP
jgi:hypothetical protein